MVGSHELPTRDGARPYWTARYVMEHYVDVLWSRPVIRIHASISVVAMDVINALLIADVRGILIGERRSPTPVLQLFGPLGKTFEQFRALRLERGSQVSPRSNS